MKRKDIILKNSLVGLFSQLIAQILQFYIRKCILKYIGVETLGISSTLASVLSTLSLAELGFQDAVVFYLYKPIKDSDEHKINKIMAVLKRVYEGIGIIFIICAIVVVPFLKYILKGIAVDRNVIGYYCLMSLNIAMTYFFAYKRALLYADQKEYISKIVDSFMNIFVCILKIFIVCYYKSYMTYLLLQVIQTILSNLIINRYCRKKYCFLSIEKFDWKIFKTIKKDVKNVFLSKIAGYVYDATDNLVISIFVGTINVGYLSNYTLFTTSLKQLVNSIFKAMTPIIGNMLIENTSLNQRESDFRFYSYIRYCLAATIVIPWMLLADSLVKVFFGEQFILKNSIAVLLAIDFYIHTVYSTCCEYINGAGLFKIDKNIAMTGATINLLFSIVFVKRIGVEGVLIGTVISQIFFWLGRSAVVYFKIFRIGWSGYVKYIAENVTWVIYVLIVVVISRLENNFFPQQTMLISFIRTFLICEINNAVVQLAIIFFSNKRQRIICIFRTYKKEMRK